MERKNRYELNKTAAYRYLKLCAMLEAKTERQEKENYKKLCKAKRR